MPETETLNQTQSPYKIACIRNLLYAFNHLEKARDCAGVAEDPFLVGAIALTVKTVYGVAAEYNEYWGTQVPIPDGE